MRGKKSDPEFVSSFIDQCLQHGFTTSPEIVEQAKQQIKDINEKIIEVGKLKVVRSKLLDVIITLEERQSKNEESDLLPLFKIQYPQTCKKICDHITNPDLVIPNNDPEVIFCIKQLIGAKIISKVSNQLVPSERFDEYRNFVLRIK